MHKTYEPHQNTFVIKRVKERGNIKKRLIKMTIDFLKTTTMLS